MMEPTKTLAMLLTLSGILLAGCAVDSAGFESTEEPLGSVEQATSTTNGTTLNGTTLNGTTLNGTDFIGLTWKIPSSGLFGVELRFDDIKVAPDPTPVWRCNYVLGKLRCANTSANENADVLLYTISGRRYTCTKSGCTYQAWGPMCPGANEAIPIKGKWGSAANPGGKEANTDSSHITFACTGSAMAACAQVLQYKPWIDPAMDQFHQSCVRMKRADYCGTGDSYTHDGTLIDVVDNYGVQSATTSGNWIGDAEWGPNGATCFYAGRFSASEWEGQDFNGDGVVGNVPFHATPECPTPTTNGNCMMPQKFFQNYCGNVQGVYNCADAGLRTPYLYPSPYSSGNYLLNRVAQ